MTEMADEKETQPPATIPTTIRKARPGRKPRTRGRPTSSDAADTRWTLRGVSGVTRSLAIEAFRAIDCAGMARVDFFVGRAKHEIWVHEINTIPGFTPISMYPKLWAASGLAFPGSVARLIDLARMN